MVSEMVYQIFDDSATFVSAILLVATLYFFAEVNHEEVDTKNPLKVELEEGEVIDDENEIYDLTTEYLDVRDFKDIKLPQINTIEIRKKMWFDEDNLPSNLFSQYPTLENVYFIYNNTTIRCSQNRYTIVHKRNVHNSIVSSIVSEGRLHYAEEHDFFNNAVEEEFYKCGVSWSDWCCEEHFDQCSCSYKECEDCDACKECMTCYTKDDEECAEIIDSLKDDTWLGTTPKEEIFPILRNVIKHSNIFMIEIDDASLENVEKFDEDSEIVFWTMVNADDEYGYEEIKSKSQTYKVGALFGCTPKHSNIFYVIDRTHGWVTQEFYDKYIDGEEDCMYTWRHLIKPDYREFE